MEKTLTIRLDKKQDAALARRAGQRGLTKSEFVRELIKNALLGVPLGARVGHLAGAIDNFPKNLTGWSVKLKNAISETHTDDRSWQ